MSTIEWYVVQVQSGQEKKMLQAIEAVCAEQDESSDKVLRVDECFVPKFRSQKKQRGEWRPVERLLLPGYVIVAIDDPDALAQRLRRVPDFCRVLAMGETYVPLTSYERSWIETCTNRGERVIPMSFGYKEGDSLVVTEGPLKGHEGLITKINRSASLAFLEFHVGQLTIKTTVGLGIVPKSEAQAG